MLGCAAATPPWGKISDIFGRKPILLTANVVFLIGSLLCGLAIDAKMLIAGRAVQGIGSGGLLSLANICVADLFSQRLVSFSRLDTANRADHAASTMALSAASGPSPRQ